MFFLIRIIIWIVGLFFLLHLALGFFGYEFNTDYFKENQESCQEKIAECREGLVATGSAGAKDACSIDCINPKLFIRKEQ